MKYVFAVGNSCFFKILKDKNVKSFLISYAYKNDVLKILDDKSNCKYLERSDVILFIDSGAFTTWTKGQLISVKEYGNFLLRLKKDYPKINFKFINLDVIPGKCNKRLTQKDIEESAQKGWNNYKYLKSRGLNVLHIFHQFEDVKWLKKLMASSDYIGISPANDRSIKSRLAWLKWVFSITKDSVKTHGFGITAKAVLKDIPFYSADSASWTAGVRWGHIIDNQDMYQVKAKHQRSFNKVLNFDIDDKLKLESFITDLWVYKKSNKE